MPSNPETTSVSCGVIDLAPEIIRYAHALGRWHAAWRFAAPELRRTVALAQISAAWDVLRRDAGPGEFGPAHEVPVGSTSLLNSDDLRREAMLLWLADNGAPAIAEAASLLARATGARRRFDADDQALLEAARDALAAPPSGKGAIARAIHIKVGVDDPVLASISVIVQAVDQLRRDPAFMEGAGEETTHILPHGTLRHFVPASPGAAWALNLALLAHQSSSGIPPCPGFVSRQLFKALEPEEIAAALVAAAALALEGAYRLVERIEPQLVRGADALASLSRNSRAREVWMLVVAQGSVSRAQVARAFGLSRAGADIQAHALARAKLADLGPAGRIEWVRPPVPSNELDAPSGSGIAMARIFADFDAEMSEIDRVLSEKAGR